MESNNENAIVAGLPDSSSFRYIKSDIDIAISGYPLVAFYAESEKNYYYDCVVYLPNNATGDFLPSISFDKVDDEDVLQVTVILFDPIPNQLAVSGLYSLYAFSASFTFDKKIKASNTKAKDFRTSPTSRGTYTVVSDPNKPGN